MVLAIGILGVASMQTAAGGSNSVARQIMAAENLASQQIELLMLLPYDDDLLAITDPADPDDDHVNADITGYRVSWDVIENLLPENGIKTITVTARSNGLKPGVLRPRVVLTHYKAEL